MLLIGNWSSIIFAISILGCSPHVFHPQGGALSNLCSPVVTALYSRWRTDVPSDRLQRVEVRSCDDGLGPLLQLAAYRDNDLNPSLLVETNRSGIVKLAWVRDVFAIETSGASSNVVQVIVFEKGQPKLVVDEAIKAYARIEMSWKRIVIGLPGEDGTERVVEFPTASN